MIDLSSLTAAFLFHETCFFLDIHVEQVENCIFGILLYRAW